VESITLGPYSGNAAVNAYCGESLFELDRIGRENTNAQDAFQAVRAKMEDMTNGFYPIPLRSVTSSLDRVALMLTRTAPENGRELSDLLGITVGWSVVTFAIISRTISRSDDESPLQPWANFVKMSGFVPGRGLWIWEKLVRPRLALPVAPTPPIAKSKSVEGVGGDQSGEMPATSSGRTTTNSTGQ
jgi:hypothetical protein